MSFSSSRTSAWKPCVSRLGSDSMLAIRGTSDGGSQTEHLGNGCGIFKRRSRKPEHSSARTGTGRRRSDGLGGEVQQVPVGEQQCRGAGQQDLGGRRNERRCGGGDVERRRRRQVATGASDIVELVPQIQKEFHRRRLYGAAMRGGVLALTVADTTYRLSGAAGRAEAWLRTASPRGCDKTRSSCSASSS